MGCECYGVRKQQTTKPQNAPIDKKYEEKLVSKEEILECHQDDNPYKLKATTSQIKGKIVEDLRFNTQNQIYVNADRALKLNFKNIIAYHVRTVTLGDNGNKFGLPAIQYLASILKRCPNIEKVVLNDMLIKEVQDSDKDRAKAVKLLLQAIQDHKKLSTVQISQIDLSSPECLEPLLNLLQNTQSLNVLGISSCSIDDEGAEQIATTLDENEYIMLQKMYLNNNKIDNWGLSEISRVIQNQACIQEIDISNNNCEQGLSNLLDACFYCKDTIRYVNIANNGGINEAIGHLNQLIDTCNNVEYLNISNLQMDSNFIESVAKSILYQVRQQECRLKQLIWDKDLHLTPEIAIQLVEDLCKQKTSLELVTMNQVFIDQQTIGKASQLFQNSGIDYSLDPAEQEGGDS